MNILLFCVNADGPVEIRRQMNLFSVVFSCIVDRSLHPALSQLHQDKYSLYRDVTLPFENQNTKMFFQVCSTEPSLRAARPSPAGPSTTNPSSTPRSWPGRWAAPTQTPWTWSTAWGAKPSGSWWTRTSNRRGTTSPSAPWWTETWSLTIPRFSCSRWGSAVIRGARGERQRGVTVTFRNS